MSTYVRISKAYTGANGASNESLELTVSSRMESDDEGASIEDLLDIDAACTAAAAAAAAADDGDIIEEHDELAANEVAGRSYEAAFGVRKPFPRGSLDHRALAMVANGGMEEWNVWPAKAQGMPSWETA
eukprot:1128002-Pelagomonas_calceolata.AAC.4